MNTVVLIEVVPSRDGRRAVRLAATNSDQITMLPSEGDRSV